MHGDPNGGGSTSSEIIFDQGEFITQIEGRSNTLWILQLTLVTTTRMLRWPPAPVFNYLAMGQYSLTV